MVAERAESKRVRIGTLTEDDFDLDYAPGRSESTMTPAHRARLDEMAARIRAEADAKKK